MFSIMGCYAQSQKLCYVEPKRLLLVMGLIFTTVLIYQSSLLPYQTVLSSLLTVKSMMVVVGESTNKGLDMGKDINGFIPFSGDRKPENDSVIGEVVPLHKSPMLESDNIQVPFSGDRKPEIDSVIGEVVPLHKSPMLESDNIQVPFSGDRKPEIDSVIGEVVPLHKSPMLESDNIQVPFSGDRKPEIDSGIGEVVPLDKSPMLESDNILASDKTRDFEQYRVDNEDSNSTLGNVGSLGILPVVASNSLNLVSNLKANSSDNFVSRKSKISSVSQQTTEKISKGENNGVLESGKVTSHDNSFMTIDPVMKNRRRMPPMSISMMNSLLLRSHISSNSTKPQWSSERDQELLAARSKIESASILKIHFELYASVFQNVSRFKRSYELMESTLKVYIYKEGEKPIFHQPELKGIYSSEGWFMKLMERNKQFIVEDPTKAHLFYLPFSSSVLRKTLFEQNIKNLGQYLKNYVDMIAQKYDHWNRTGGADHFLAACHDWAPRETTDSMGMCIRALCNANVARDFKIGKDVSLPVTYVRMPENPLKSLGGKPPSQRPILAFFAGSMHGYLRPILLKYWENKDPDMKIFGPMSPNVTGKMTYKQHMKSSRYCICARGYEVHTPRVIEAIYYECVPVIISDNYVPPFFEVLDWKKFSVSITEEDIPHLKDILLSIPKKKYLMLQRGVKNVQRHFLWHEKPVKYDIFHMILHSIWYNRVFQIKPT